MRATKSSITARSSGSTLEVLRTVEEVGEAIGQRRTVAGRPLRPHRETSRGMRSTGDERHALCRALRRATRHRPRCAGRAREARSVVVRGISAGVSGHRCPPPRSLSRASLVAPRSRPTARPRNRAAAPRSSAVTVVQLEQQPLEVRRHLDVHRRAHRRHDRLGRCGRSRAGEDVVLVGGRSRAADRRAHLPATQPAKMLPKLPVGTLEPDRRAPSAVAAVT